MPKGGVNELLKSSDGRRYLRKLQEKYKVDIAQPGSEIFEKVWQPKLDKKKKDDEKAVARSKAEWAELEERKEYEKYRKLHTNKKFL